VAPTRRAEESFCIRSLRILHVRKSRITDILVLGTDAGRPAFHDHEGFASYLM